MSSSNHGSTSPHAEHATTPAELDGPWNRPLSELTAEDLLGALLNGWGLTYVVPRTLERLEADPLASAGRFPGDLLRGLIEVRANFWSRHPRLYARYREALRAGAAARRRLPPDQRFDFWTDALSITHVVQPGDTRE